MNKRLDFGDVFGRVFQTYGKYFVPLITYSAIFYAAIALLYALVIGVLLANVGAAILVSVVGVAITVIGTFLLTAAYISSVDAAERTGTFPPFAETWEKIKPIIGGLIVTALLAGLGIMVGLIAIVIPGLVLMTWWAVASPVVVLEGVSGIDALKRSRELVSGEGWTVFGLVVVVSILTGIASGIIGGIVGSIFSFSDLTRSFANEFAGGVLTAPVSALVTLLIYRGLIGQTPPPASGPGTPAGTTPPTAVAPVTPAPVAPTSAPAPEPPHNGPFV